MANTAITPTIVVAPIYNEEALICDFMEHVAIAAPHLPVAGLVLVDDGSNDRSIEKIIEKAKEVPFPVRLVRLSRNFGHQIACLAALEAGTKWAKELGVDWVGLMDADLQDDPMDLCELAKESHENDIIYGVRAARRDGFVMKTFAPIFYRILSARTHFSIPQNAGTFSLIRASIAQQLCAGADANPYFPGLRAWAGFRQIGVPLVRKPRLAGDSKVGLLGLVRLSIRAFFQYSNLALEGILYLGTFIFATSILASAYMIGQKLLGFADVPGATMMITLQFISLGIQLLVLAMIAYMIQRLVANTSRRPIWLVQDDRVLDK